MKRRVRVSQDAKEHARTAARWWRGNRPEAPRLFRDELDRALELLLVAPEMGAPYDDADVPGLRRVPLQQTRYHVYYRYDDASEQIVILAVWSALRGRPPALHAR